mgnify:CR=1
MKRYLIFIVLVWSCKSNTPSTSKPNNLIERNTFTELLVETSLLEGHLASINTNVPDVRDEALGKYKGVFKKFNITNKQYQDSYGYYVQQKYFKDMIQEAIDKVSKKEDQMKDLPEINQMSFEQLKTLLRQDGFDAFLQKDSTLSHEEKIDTIANYYRLNPDKLEIINLDSLSFQYSLNRFKEGKQLFKTLEKSLKIKND